MTLPRTLEQKYVGSKQNKASQIRLSQAKIATQTKRDVPLENVNIFNNSSYL